LALGTALFPPDRAEAFVKPLLERLSRQFGEAQYFCTHQDFELHIWARARQGRLVRGYGWLGQKCLTLWDEGRQTREERDLGFRCFDGGPPVVEQGPDKSVTPPDEGNVLQLASLWSVDPTTLDERPLGTMENRRWLHCRQPSVVSSQILEKTLFRLSAIANFRKYVRMGSP
jgi:hypothetical protein